MTTSAHPEAVWTGGGLNARCFRCGNTCTLRIARYDKISHHRCECGGSLSPGKPGPNRGRYVCPITTEIVTLGQTGVQLDRAYRLAFRPGRVAVGTPHETLVATPYAYMKVILDRLDGSVFGANCVVDRDFDPHLYDHLPEPARSQRLGPGLGLVPIEHDQSTAPLVNTRLVYRACVACGCRVLDHPDNRVAADRWAPLRRVVIRKRKGGTHVIQVDQGPHPVGSLACKDCSDQHNQPGRTDPRGLPCE